MFANATLAARIERAECGMLTELTDAAATRRVKEAVFCARVAGGIAAFTGPGSPANKFAGLGFDGVPSAADLDMVERAFAERSAPLQVEFSSLGNPAVARLLTARGYELIGFENVLGRPLNLSELEAGDSATIAIERVGADAASTWMDVVATGFLNPSNRPIGWTNAFFEGDTQPHGFDALEEDDEDEAKEDVLASDPEHEELDVLEDTPDFLQETPEHDRLWFEQKPPKDFDFDG